MTSNTYVFLATSSFISGYNFVTSFGHASIASWWLQMPLDVLGCPPTHQHTAVCVRICRPSLTAVAVFVCRRARSGGNGAAYDQRPAGSRHQERDFLGVSSRQSPRWVRPPPPQRPAPALSGTRLAATTTGRSRPSRHYPLALSFLKLKW